MKRILFYSVIFFLFSCKKEDNPVFRNPQKGDIYINEIAFLEGNISYNADPNANPNFVYMRPIYTENQNFKNDKIAEKELYKQNYFKDSILDIRKFEDNVKPNQIYFLNDKKTITFRNIIEENGDMKFKVQRGDEISIFDYGYSHIMGINLIDLNKDGIKDILTLEQGYVSNNYLYYFYIYSPIQKK